MIHCEEIFKQRHQNLNLHASLVRGAIASALARGNLGRGAGVAGRHVEGRVPQEEVARPQQQGHRFGGHDGEVLGGREMGETESMPEDDVLVVDFGLRVGVDPLG